MLRCTRRACPHIVVRPYNKSPRVMAFSNPLSLGNHRPPVSSPKSRRRVVLVFASPAWIVITPVYSVRVPDTASLYKIGELHTIAPDFAHARYASDNAVMDLKSTEWLLPHRRRVFTGEPRISLRVDVEAPDAATASFLEFHKGGVTRRVIWV